MRKAAAEFDGVTKKDVERYGKVIKALPEDRRAAATDALVWAHQGNPIIIARKAFVVDDEEIVASSVRVFCEMGMPFNDRSFGPFCAGVLRKMGKKDPKTGTFYKCSARWVMDFLSRYPDLRRYKSSPLDPARVRAAAPETRDSLFDLIPIVRRRMARENPAIAGRWQTLRDVPNEALYNYDEGGKDTNVARTKVLGSFALCNSKFNRVFQITDGDHPPFHVTNGLTTRADGRFVIPPFLIHSRPGNEKPELSDGDVKGIARVVGRATDGSARIENPTGIQVAVSTNGSMTRDLFPRWCEHFVNHLPSHQGKGKMPVVLFLDGHTSRWNYNALHFLRENNV